MRRRNMAHIHPPHILHPRIALQAGMELVVPDINRIDKSRAASQQNIAKAAG